LTETSEEAAFVGIVEDIAVLARKLAEKEPFKSASGPEALLALATHLERMVAATRTGQTPVISVRPVAAEEERSMTAASPPGCSAA
jgi:hypothetical protein